MRMALVLAALAAAGCHESGEGDAPDADTAASFTSNCTAGAPDPESAKPAGHVDGRSAILELAHKTVEARRHFIETLG